MDSPLTTDHSPLTMTVLIITPNYTPAICGVGDHTAHLQRELTATGNKVLLLTGTPGQDNINSFSVAAFDGTMLPTLRKLITKHQVDRILWQYVPYSYQTKGLPFWWPLLMLRLRQKGLKQVIFFHEVSIRLWGYGVKRLVLAFLQRVIANSAAIAANRTITSIQLFRSYFVFNKPEIVPISANVVSSNWSVVSGVRVSKKVSDAPIAIGRSVVNHEGASGVVSKTMRGDGVGGESTIFCFANRADSALLEALKNINRQVPVKLVLGGMIQQAKKKELIAWISEFDLETVIYFTGTVDAERLANYVASASVFIQPQIVERGNEGGVSAKNGTIMAAMSIGKAIVTCPGDMTDPRLFRDGENMLLMPYGDAVGYEQALLALLTDKPLANELGEAAATTYQEYCSWEVTSKLIETNLK
ncbi:MAG: glycosyltransferase family 4 protein [Bacteroidota bacterium]